MFQCKILVNGKENFFPVSNNPFIGRADTVCCAVEQSTKHPFAIVEAYYGSTHVCTYSGGIRDDELKFKTLEDFKSILLDTYDERLNSFWEEQYEMYVNGYRGVRLHDTTLVALS